MGSIYYQNILQIKENLFESEKNRLILEQEYLTLHSNIQKKKIECKKSEHELWRLRNQLKSSMESCNNFMSELTVASDQVNMASQRLQNQLMKLQSYKRQIALYGKQEKAGKGGSIRDKKRSNDVMLRMNSAGDTEKFGNLSKQSTVLSETSKSSFQSEEISNKTNIDIINNLSSNKIEVVSNLSSKSSSYEQPDDFKMTDVSRKSSKLDYNNKSNVQRKLSGKSDHNDTRNDFISSDETPLPVMTNSKKHDFISNEDHITNTTVADVHIKQDISQFESCSLQGLSNMFHFIEVALQDGEYKVHNGVKRLTVQDLLSLYHVEFKGGVKQEIARNIIQLANKGITLSSHDIVSVSQVAMQQLGHLNMTLPRDALFTDTWLENCSDHEFEYNMIRCNLPQGKAEVWQIVFQHLQILVTQQVMPVKDIVDLFTPSLIQVNSIQINKMKALLTRTLSSHHVTSTEYQIHNITSSNNDNNNHNNNNDNVSTRKDSSSHAISTTSQQHKSLLNKNDDADDSSSTNSVAAVSKPFVFGHNVESSYKKKVTSHDQESSSNKDEDEEDEDDSDAIISSAHKSEINTVESIQHHHPQYSMSNYDNDNDEEEDDVLSFTSDKFTLPNSVNAQAARSIEVKKVRKFSLKNMKVSNASLDEGNANDDLDGLILLPGTSNSSSNNLKFGIVNAPNKTMIPSSVTANTLINNSATMKPPNALAKIVNSLNDLSILSIESEDVSESQATGRLSSISVGFHNNNNNNNNNNNIKKMKKQSTLSPTNNEDSDLDFYD